MLPLRLDMKKPATENALSLGKIRARERPEIDLQSFLFQDYWYVIISRAIRADEMVRHDHTLKHSKCNYFILSISSIEKHSFM